MELVLIVALNLVSVVGIVVFSLLSRAKSEALFLSKLESISSSAMLHLKAGSATEVLNVETLRKEADVKLDALEAALKADTSIKENTLPTKDIIKGKDESGKDVTIDMASGRWEML